MFQRPSLTLSAPSLSSLSRLSQWLVLMSACVATVLLVAQSRATPVPASTGPATLEMDPLSDIVAREIVNRCGAWPLPDRAVIWLKASRSPLELRDYRITLPQAWPPLISHGWAQRALRRVSDGQLLLWREGGYFGEAMWAVLPGDGSCKRQLPQLEF